MFAAVRGLFGALRAAQSESREYEDVIPPDYKFPPDQPTKTVKLNGPKTQELDRVQAEPTPRKG